MGPCTDTVLGTASSIERIVHRLRNLELGLDEEELPEEESGQLMPLNGDERLGELLERSWVRLDLPSNANRAAPLPWERGGEEDVVGEKETGKKRRVNAPTLAELTIEDEELRRLRRMRMTLRERISVAKAGITQDVLEKIHHSSVLHKSELARLKFHEDLAHDMKTTHEIVEVGLGFLESNVDQANPVQTVFFFTAMPKAFFINGSSFTLPAKEKNKEHLLVPHRCSDGRITMHWLL